MLVTDIKPSKKNSNYIQLFSEEKYIGSIFVDFYIQNHIERNTEINEELLNSLIQQTTEKRMFDLCVNYILRRQRSKKEIQEYINKKLYKFKLKLEQENLDAIFEKLSKYNYINDEAFADMWANQRLKKGYGPGRLRQELVMKGIERNTIDQVIYNLDGEEINIQKAKIEEKYLRNKKFKNEYEKDWKLKQYLFSKGFN